MTADKKIKDDSIDNLMKFVVLVFSCGFIFNTQLHWFIRGILLLNIVVTILSCLEDKRL